MSPVQLSQHEVSEHDSIKHCQKKKNHLPCCMRHLLLLVIISIVTALNANETFNVFEVIARTNINQQDIFTVCYLLGREWSACDVPSKSAKTRADEVIEIWFGQVLVPFIQH